MPDTTACTTYHAISLGKGLDILTTKATPSSDRQNKKPQDTPCKKIDEVNECSDLLILSALYSAFRNARNLGYTATDAIDAAFECKLISSMFSSEDRMIAAKESKAYLARAEAGDFIVNY